MTGTRTASDLDRVVEVINPGGAHDAVLICEHASAHIPPEFNDLGLSSDAVASHIAWDPGALATARAMSKHMDAVLVASCVSRLVYDCNRPPEAPSAMPEVSEIYSVPGNQNLSEEERGARIEAYYRPFETTVAKVLSRRHFPPVLVTIHSFTPTFRGQTRDVEIGILHDDDARLADAILSAASGYDIRRNEPYGPIDGVTHTLKHHALPAKLLNVMIEIRNDLIATPESCTSMAHTLTDWIEQGLAALNLPVRRGEAQ